ncbi:hypothetical protein V8C42DRAFT_333412 [Trichoderma barbatum]
MAWIDAYYVFRAFTGLGFCTQWIVMMQNGSFMTMLWTNLKGVFPTGTPVKTSWTGIWPVDFVLGLLVVFFGAVNNVADLTDLGPFLMLVDLVFTLVVFNIMTLVEDRRNRKTGPLRYPAVWQFLWNWCGAASVLPVYCHLYLSKRLGSKTSLLSNEQAQALPLTALWSIVISLPLLLPAAFGAGPFDIQDGVVVWFFGPFLLGPFQDLISVLFSGENYKGIHKPVILAYWIVGLFSAVAHVGVAVWAYTAPELSWYRIYWPNHAAVIADSPTYMTEGAMLFMQYDHVLIYLCVIGMGLYMLSPQKAVTAPFLGERVRAGWPMAKLTAITAVAGPGAGLAWLMCHREGELDAAAAQRKLK